MTLQPTTKMALQAVIAITIAEWIAWYFHLSRGYWITLTAMALTMQTWGESIKRSIERVSMTIVGGICGTGLYFLIPHNSILILTLLLIFVFFSVYMLQIYYLISIFCLTCFVVFLFALTGEWTVAILLDRIVETVIGAVIALLVGMFCFPLKTNLMQLLRQYLQGIHTTIHTIFEENQYLQNQRISRQLMLEFRKIQKSAIAIRFELLFHRLSHRDFYTLLNKIALCNQYIINLMDAYRLLIKHLNPHDKQDIELTVQTTLFNIQKTIEQLETLQPTELVPVTRVTQLLTQAIQEKPERFANLENEALGFFNLMYFFARINTCLDEINQIMQKAIV